MNEKLKINITEYPYNAKGDGITFKIKPSVFLYSLSVGVILGVFQFINTKAIANINGTLLFPTYNAGTLILSTLSSILILKDKLIFKCTSANEFS